MSPLNAHKGKTAVPTPVFHRETKKNRQRDAWRFFKVETTDQSLP
jgi:hypothetical protein